MLLMCLLSKVCSHGSKQTSTEPLPRPKAKARYDASVSNYDSTQHKQKILFETLRSLSYLDCISSIKDLRSFTASAGVRSDIDFTITCMQSNIEFETVKTDDLIAVKSGGI